MPNFHLFLYNVIIAFDHPGYKTAIILNISAQYETCKNMMPQKTKFIK